MRIPKFQPTGKKLSPPKRRRKRSNRFLRTRPIELSYTLLHLFGKGEDDLSDEDELSFVDRYEGEEDL